MPAGAPALNAQARTGNTGRHLLSRVSVSAPGLRGEGACVAIPIAVNRPAPIGVRDDEADSFMRDHRGRLPFTCHDVKQKCRATRLSRA